MKSIKIWVSLFLVSFLIIGCAVVPQNVANKNVAPDSSVPDSYKTKYVGGILGYITEDNKVYYTEDLKPHQKIGAIKFIIITSNKRDEYNNNIDLYKVLLFQAKTYKIEKDSGISSFIDKDKNSVWKIDAEHSKYFMLMAQWRRNHVSPDSTWDKIKDKVFE